MMSRFAYNILCNILQKGTQNLYRGIVQKENPKSAYLKQTKKNGT